MSMMFPTIFALGVKGLGTRTKSGGALIVMSIIGGAAITPLMGRLADVSGVAHAYAVPAACFVGVALYALFAAEPEAEEVAAEPRIALG
jgi:FHS family L-fucose permease-like MFS transporter